MRITNPGSWFATDQHGRTTHHNAAAVYCHVTQPSRWFTHISFLRKTARYELD
jgi:hypothetical protein